MASDAVEHRVTTKLAEIFISVYKETSNLIFLLHTWKVCILVLCLCKALTCIYNNEPVH